MKPIYKIILISTICLLLASGIATATTYIPAGTVDDYQLDVANETYVLQGDVSANGTAFTATTGYITFQGNNHTITYGLTGNGYGLNLYARSDCIVDDVVIRSTGSDTNGFGFVLMAGSHNNTVNNINVSVTSAPAIEMDESHNNTISNFYAKSVDSHGLHVSPTYNNTFSNGTIISDDLSAVYGGEPSGNTFIDCDIYSENYSAVQFSFDGLSNEFINCTLGSNLKYGLYLEKGSNDNDFQDCTFNSISLRGYMIDNSSGNTFQNTAVNSYLSNYPTYTENSILILGDSISAGGNSGTPIGAWGIDLDALFAISDYPSRYSISNQAFPGETAEEARLRISQDMDIFSPNIVTILYGANDLSAARNEQDIIDDVLWIAQYAESDGAIPYIITTPATSSSNELRIAYDQNLTTQAEAAGFTVINAYDAIDSNPLNGEYDAYDVTYYADGVHPNAAGNELIAQAVYDVVYSPPPPPGPWEENTDAVDLWEDVAAILIVAALLIPIGLVLYALRGGKVTITKDVVSIAIGVLILIVIFAIIPMLGDKISGV